MKSVFRRPILVIGPLSLALSCSDTAPSDSTSAHSITDATRVEAPATDIVDSREEAVIGVQHDVLPASSADEFGGNAAGWLEPGIADISLKPLPHVALDHLANKYGLSNAAAEAALRKQEVSLVAQQQLRATHGDNIVETRIDTPTGDLLVYTRDRATADAIESAGFRASVLTPVAGLQEARTEVSRILTEFSISNSLVYTAPLWDGLIVGAPNTLDADTQAALTTALTMVPVPVTVRLEAPMAESRSNHGEAIGLEGGFFGHTGSFHMVNTSTGAYYLGTAGHAETTLGRERYEVNVNDPEESGVFLLGRAEWSTRAENTSGVDIAGIRLMNGIEHRVTRNILLDGDPVQINSTATATVGMSVCYVGSTTAQDGACGEVEATGILQNREVFNFSPKVDFGDSGGPVFTSGGAAVGMTIGFGAYSIAEHFERFQEAGYDIHREPVKVVWFRKRNASGFSLDGNGGAANGTNVYLWHGNSRNKNQAWIEIPRGNGFYTYQKYGTSFCLDGGNGGDRGQNVYLWRCKGNNRNQHWKKIRITNLYWRLEKRNASGYSIDGRSGGADGQNVHLWSSSNNNQNQHWRISNNPDFSL